MLFIITINCSLYDDDNDGDFFFHFHLYFLTSTCAVAQSHHPLAIYLAYLVQCCWIQQVVQGIFKYCCPHSPV